MVCVLLNFLQCSEIHSFSRTCLLLSICLCIFLCMCVKRWVCLYVHTCLLYVCKPGRLTRAAWHKSRCGFCGLCFQNSIAQYIPTLCALAGRELSTSQQQREPCMCGWMYIHTYKCMYIWIRIYEDARILVSSAAQDSRTKHQLESMKLLCCTLHSVFQNEIKVGYLKPH